MKALASLLFGAFAAVVAVLLHQTLPPLGVILGIAFTYFAVWLTGRGYGNRKYKWAATFGWLLVITRAATFGAGQELLVQGDGVGSALLLIGTFVALIAVVARI